MVSRTGQIYPELKPPPAAHFAPAPRPASPLSGAAFFFLLGFVFLATSRILDFTAPGLHLPLIFAVLALVLTAASEGLAGVLSTTVGKLMGLYAAWFLLCIPFSQWKGGSLNVLTDQFSRSLLVFAMVTASVNTAKRVQALMAVIGSGLAVSMVISLAQNARIDGRLTMTLGQYANPNDLAQAMLLGMCFLPMLGVWRNSRFLKIAAYLTAIPFLYATFLTGSRSGLLTLALMAVAAVLFVSPAKKILLIVALPMLGLGLLSVSESARVRIKTLLNDGEVKTYSEETAVASTEARLTTLKQSLQLTVENPLFGVGPGVFQAAAADLQKDEGRRAFWVETHNAYTQVSSETGIPGAIFFCGAVLLVLARSFRLWRSTAQREAYRGWNLTVGCFVTGFFTFAVTSLFSSVAYGALFWMLIALGATVVQVTERGLATGHAPPLRPASFPWAVPAPSQAIAGTRVTLSGRIKSVRPRK